VRNPSILVGPWRKFRALPARQQRVAAAALVLLPLFWLGLHLLGLSRWRALTLRAAHARSHRTLDDARALGELVNAVARHSPLPAACLTRSLVAEWLLRRRGHDAQLRIGVQRTSDGIAAHAWVESEGVPVNDRPDIAESFLPFAELAKASSLRFS
jgi:hypothetical protein